MRLPWIGLSRYGIGFGLQHATAGTIAVSVIPAAVVSVADEADEESVLGVAMTPDARVVQPSSASYPVADGPTTGYSRGQAHPNIWITHVDGFPIERNTATAFIAMRTAAARDGIELRIVSGFRTMEHQRALYAEYLAGRGPLAAAPGHSNHQMGNAIDLNTRDPGVLRWLNAHARAFRIYRTVRPEPWHWEFAPVGVPVFS